MSVPATVIYFSLYDHLKYRCGYRENDPSTKYIPALAGAAARGNNKLLMSELIQKVVTNAVSKPTLIILLLILCNVQA